MKSMASGIIEVSQTQESKSRFFVHQTIESRLTNIAKRDRIFTYGELSLQPIGDRLISVSRTNDEAFQS